MQILLGEVQWYVRYAKIFICKLCIVCIVMCCVLSLVLISWESALDVFSLHLYTHYLNLKMKMEGTVRSIVWILYALEHWWFQQEETQMLGDHVLNTVNSPQKRSSTKWKIEPRQKRNCCLSYPHMLCLFQSRKSDIFIPSYKNVLGMDGRAYQELWHCGLGFMSCVPHFVSYYWKPWLRLGKDIVLQVSVYLLIFSLNHHLSLTVCFELCI